MSFIYSVILSILTVFSSLFVPFSTAPVPENTDDGFVPVMRFIATSDTHIQVLGDKGCQRVAKMIKSAYAYSEADKDYTSLDAVVFSGDVTDDGAFTSFSAFAATTDKVIREGTERLAVLAKSHDGGMYDSSSLEMFTALTGQETDFHRVINGFHFIGISRSPEKGVHYSDEQVKWLDNELKKATEDAPLQPVFVFQHEHILDTVFGSYTYDGWGMDTFRAVLQKYPQVIDISGHSHYPANDPRSIWQGEFTAIGDGGLAYYEFTVDDETAVHPDGYKSMTQALMIEVDKDNRVLVRVLDVDAGEFVAEYLVDNVASPVKLKYNHDLRKAVSSAPEFSEDANVSVKEAFGKYTFTFPQANVKGEDNKVYLYRLICEDENGNELLSQWTLSGYYYAEVPETVSFNAVKLPDNTKKAYIIAEDVWGNQSDALICFEK